MFSELPADDRYQGMTKWDDGTRSVRATGVGEHVRAAIMAHLDKPRVEVNDDGGRS